MKLFKGNNKDFNILQYIAFNYGIIASKTTTIKQLKELIKQNETI